MEDYISISTLNDFIFCPYSIYLHNVYMEMDEGLYHATPQTRGRIAHETIDKKKASNRADDLQSLPVMSEEYGLMGKIDIYKGKEGVYHRLWFKRKSLICDLMEPFRCIVDRTIRTAINRKQFSEKDFAIEQENMMQHDTPQELLWELLRIPTVNGKDREIDAAVFLADYFRAHGIGAHVEAIDEKRGNVVTDVIAVAQYALKRDAVYTTKKAIYLVEAIVGLKNWHELSKKNKTNE